MRTADAARGGARLGQALQLGRRRRHGHQRHRPEGPRNAANSCAQEFLDTYAWKTKRTIGKTKKYSEAQIADVTGVAFRQTDEKLRICLLRAPTASTGRSPARCCTSMSAPSTQSWTTAPCGRSAMPSWVSFEFWWAYVDCCRALAKKAGVSVRDLDQALWAFSEANQPKGTR